MIEVKNLKKKFTKQKNKKEKEEFYAVDDLSFIAKEGEIVGILGPNGAGKTTLLRMIAGIMNPSSGSVTFDGLTYEKNALDIKRKLAFLSGNTKIYQSISAYELLKMCCEYYDVSKSEIDSRIQEVSAVLEMEKFLYNRIENLSSGQMQRVNIARCLIHHPSYYIMDEATNALDILASQIILDFMKSEKKKGKCILYSTHYMEEAENICDRVIMLNKGKIIKEGTPSSIKKDTHTTNLRDAFFALIGGKRNEE